MKVQFIGYDCDVIINHYSNGRKALVLISDDEVVAYATVNLPNDPINDDEVIIKDYSENEGMYDALLEAKIIGPALRYIRTGFVSCPVCKLLISE
jgi:hypothetical protein